MSEIIKEETTKKEKRKMEQKDLMTLLQLVLFCSGAFLASNLVGNIDMNIGYALKYCVMIMSGTFLGQWLAKVEEKEYDQLLGNKNNRYLAIAISIALGTLVYSQLKLTGGYINYYFLFIAGLLGTSFLIDLKIQELPDLINATFLVMTVILYVLYMHTGLLDAVVRALIMTAAYSVFAYFGGLGFGDVKLLFPISMLFEYLKYIDFWTYTLIATFVYLVPLVIYNIINKKPVKGIKFAFGPFIIIGFFVTFLF